MRVLVGDCRETLRTLPSGSVHCVVTSPPYFGLRCYDHADQIGLEETPDRYVAEMVAVFREVHRVLRGDGTVWLNLGDSYSGSGKGVWNAPEERKKSVKEAYKPSIDPVKRVKTGLKPKDLIGIPWRVAFALQADGWYLRQEIIWHKPNAMPSSVKDRCTRAHEYIFMLTKSPRYYYDHEAIKTPPSEALLRQVAEGYRGSDTKDYGTGRAQSASGTKTRIIEQARKKIDKQAGHGRQHAGFNARWDAMDPEIRAALGANKRSVWTVTTKPFKDWVETVRQVRVAADAPVDGKMRKASPDCPVHGGHPAPAPMVFGGGRAGDARICNGDNGTRRVQEPQHGSAPTAPLRAPTNAVGSSGLPEQSGVQIATAHNMGTNRTGRALATNPPCRLSAQTEPNKQHRLGQPEWSEQCRDNAGSSISEGASGGNRDNQMAVDIERIPDKPDFSEASTSPSCTCEYYIERTEKTSHFATFPPDLIEPCVLAGCPPGGVVLDPFGGSGTTAGVAARHYRRAIICELNPQYAEMIPARVRAIAPDWEDLL